MLSAVVSMVGHQYVTGATTVGKVKLDIGPGPPTGDTSDLRLAAVGNRSLRIAHDRVERGLDSFMTRTSANDPMPPCDRASRKQ